MNSRNVTRIAAALLFATATAGGAAAQNARVLYYDSFEEMDTRNGGFILPEGVERVRVGGRLFATELEIEAPSGGGETPPLARWVPDPTGLSLAALQLEDGDSELGDGSLGADGSVSLWESILLDQGDRAGLSVVSWMAVPFQGDETGGTLFPETDSRIDAGPEGLNLIGFGGIQRDFDTGEPLPGGDFSNRLIINREGSAQLTDIGVGYEAGLPVFFALVFDLDESMYDMYVNGVLVRENLPFFDVAGETGKTLRELELISTARGRGVFVYDSLYHIDPDFPYEPVPFRTPLVAGDAELVPLFVETFDDNTLGVLPGSADGDMPGSRVSAAGGVETVEDASWQTPARGLIPDGASCAAQWTAPAETGDPVRLSMSLTPLAGGQVALSIGDTPLLNFEADGELSANRGDGLEASGIGILAGLPHWMSVTMDASNGLFFAKIYRAASAEDAQTVLFETEGVLPGGASLNGFSVSAAGADAFVDDLLAVRVNETGTGMAENRQRAILRETFEDDEPGASAAFPGEVVPDPTGQSLHALRADGSGPLVLLDGGAIGRSARVAFNVVPPAGSESARLDAAVSGETYPLAAFLADGTVGVVQGDTGQLASAGVAYAPEDLNRLSLVLDLLRGSFALRLNGSTTAVATGVLPNAGSSPLVLESLTLEGTSGAVFDDLLVVADHFAALFDPAEFAPYAAAEGRNLLFAEDFENNPARSEQVVNEADPRRSGLPIPTQSNGFSDWAETDVPGTRLTVGAPSAEAAYIEDPDGGSLYSLYLADRFDPQPFESFESALPFAPISTLRTVPYAFAAADLAAPAALPHVSIRWNATPMQTDRAGLALFLDTQDAEIPRPQSSMNAPAPAGTPLTAFGGNGTVLADVDGDGELDDTGLAYEAGREIRFALDIDLAAGAYALRADGRAVVSQAPLAADLADLELQRLGWFTTFVNDGDGAAMQQSPLGGGRFVIDGILVWESAAPTAVDPFLLHETMPE